MTKLSYETLFFAHVAAITRGYLNNGLTTAERASTSCGLLTDPLLTPLCLYLTYLLLLAILAKWDYLLYQFHKQ